MKDLFVVLFSLAILGLFFYAVVRVVKKVFSWFTKQTAAPTKRPPRQASQLAGKQKAKKQAKSSAPSSISTSSKAKKSSKKSPGSPKNGFSSLQEEQEFQKLLLAKASEEGKLEAVKFATQTRGWGLKEAKDYCDRVLAAAPPADKNQAPPSQATLSVATLGQLTLEKIQRDGKFEAVKELMAQTGWNLKTAKTFCDTLEEEAKKAPKKGEKATGASPLLSTGLAPTKGKQSGSASSLSEFDLMVELSMGNGDSKSLEPNKASSAPVAMPHFDLEKEVTQLMARTGWDYTTAKSYCERSLDYHKKVSAGASLKK